MLRTPVLAIIALVLPGLALPSLVEAASVTYTNNRGRRVSVKLSPGFQQGMQCVLDRLASQYNYRPGRYKYPVGCFGYRPKNKSKHPGGHACDVDQWGRDLTSLGGRKRGSPKGPVSWQNQIALANSCGVASGCEWRNADCGHFEQRSVPNCRAGARVGTSCGSGGGGAVKKRYHYGDDYKARPVKKYKNRKANYRKQPAKKRRRPATRTQAPAWAPWNSPLGNQY